MKQKQQHETQFIRLEFQIEAHNEWGRNDHQYGGQSRQDIRTLGAPFSIALHCQCIGFKVIVGALSPSQNTIFLK